MVILRAPTIGILTLITIAPVPDFRFIGSRDRAILLPFEPVICHDCLRARTLGPGPATNKCRAAHRVTANTAMICPSNATGPRRHECMRYFRLSTTGCLQLVLRTVGRLRAHHRCRGFFSPPRGGDSDSGRRDLRTDGLRETCSHRDIPLTERTGGVHPHHTTVPCAPKHTNGFRNVRRHSLPKLGDYDLEVNTSIIVYKLRRNIFQSHLNRKGRWPDHFHGGTWQSMSRQAIADLKILLNVVLVARQSPQTAHR